jgi:hypothetical protein
MLQSQEQSLLSSAGKPSHFSFSTGLEIHNYRLLKIDVEQLAHSAPLKGQFRAQNGHGVVFMYTKTTVPRYVNHSSSFLYF